MSVISPYASFCVFWLAETVDLRFSQPSLKTVVYESISLASQKIVFFKKQ